MMATMNNNKMFLSCLALCIACLCNNISYSQSEIERYDSIYSDQIRVNSINRLFNLQKNEIEIKFGSDFKYQEKQVQEMFPGELSGAYPIAYYDYQYHGFNINFYSYSKDGEKYLNYYLLSDNTFSFSVNEDVIKIGDDISTLTAIFPNSFRIADDDIRKHKTVVFLKVKIIDSQFLILIEIANQTKKIKSIKLQNIDNMA
jgi:hypothetical protein